MAEAKTAPPAAPQTANGQAPAPERCEDCATGSERVMGILGIVFAVGLLAIGLDLVTGGAVSRLAASLFGSEKDDGNPGAG